MDVFRNSQKNVESFMSYWLFPQNTELENCLSDCLALASRISSGYIWQNEQFCLLLKSDEEEGMTD